LELNVILNLGIILSALFITAYAIRKLSSVPSIVVYIILGLLLGAFVDRRSKEALDFFSEIGLVILFFFLGLEFSIERIVSVAKKIWAAGLLDLLLNFGLGFFVGYFLQFNITACIFLGAITYASSSAIVLKLLTDLKRAANIETELILGVLIFEDIVASILVAILSGIGQESAKESPVIFTVLFTLVKVLLLLGASLLIARVFASNLRNLIDKIAEEEFLAVFIIGFLFLFAGFVKFLSLSEAFGAFLAGLIFAESERLEPVEKIALPLKDIAIAIFFFSFGVSIEITSDLHRLIVALIFLFFVTFLGKILSGYLGARLANLGNTPSFRVGYSMVARGEFSVVIAYAAPAGLGIYDLSGLYILLLAFVGIFSMIYAPSLARGTPRIFRKRSSA
jgi:CPA2 family monovalent cation:H+ antiporter-2